MEIKDMRSTLFLAKFSQVQGARWAEGWHEAWHGNILYSQLIVGLKVSLIVRFHINSSPTCSSHSCFRGFFKTSIIIVTLIKVWDFNCSCATFGPSLTVSVSLEILTHLTRKCMTQERAPKHSRQHSVALPPGSSPHADTPLKSIFQFPDDRPPGHLFA